MKPNEFSASAPITRVDSSVSYRSIIACVRPSVSPGRFLKILTQAGESCEWDCFQPLSNLIQPSRCRAKDAGPDLSSGVLVSSPAVPGCSYRLARFAVE